MNNARALTALLILGCILGIAGCSTSAPLTKTTATTRGPATTTDVTRAPTRSTAAATTKAPSTAPATVNVTVPSTAAAPSPTPTVSTTAPTAAPPKTSALPPASTPLDVATLAGTYFGHDRTLVVEPNGTMHLEERSFTFCSDNPAPPCDAVIGNEIHNGIQVDLKVQSGDGPTGKAVVTASTDPTIPVGTQVTITKTPDEIAFTGGGPLDSQFFCTKNAIAGACGA